MKNDELIVLLKYAYENSKDGYAYYIRITKYEFTDFNKIYDSDLLRTVGLLSKVFKLFVIVLSIYII